MIEHLTLWLYFMQGYVMAALLRYHCNVFWFLQDYEVDKDSLEYLALHPLAPTTQPSLVEEHFDPVIDEDHNSDASTASVASDDEDKDDRSKDGKKSHVRRYTLSFYIVNLANCYLFVIIVCACIAAWILTYPTLFIHHLACR